MTRTVVFGLALILAAFVGRGYVDSSKADEPTKQEAMREKQCRYQWMDPGTWTAREERRTAVCVTSRWTVPGSMSSFSRIIDCESGWNRLAIGGGGGTYYVGLAQHALSSWSSRVRMYSPPLWNLSPRWENSRTMITVTARMMHSIGLSPWSCA